VPSLTRSMKHPPQPSTGPPYDQRSRDGLSASSNSLRTFFVKPRNETSHSESIPALPSPESTPTRRTPGAHAGKPRTSSTAS
jgi:hypothetical protein